MEAQGQGPCPVRAMQAYLQVRGDRPGPLFQYVTGQAVLRNDFNKELRWALLFCDLDPTTFKSHSFRIGAATTAAQLGMSDSQIRTLVVFSKRLSFVFLQVKFVAVGQSCWSVSFLYGAAQ